MKLKEKKLSLDKLKINNLTHSQLIKVIGGTGGAQTVTTSSKVPTNLTTIQKP